MTDGTARTVLDRYRELGDATVGVSVLWRGWRQWFFGVSFEVDDCAAAFCEIHVGPMFLSVWRDAWPCRGAVWLKGPQEIERGLRRSAERGKKRAEAGAWRTYPNSPPRSRSPGA